MDDREPFGIRIGPNGPIVTGKSTTTQHPTMVTDADAQTHTDEAAARLRLVCELEPDAHALGGQFYYDKRFESDSWPRTSYFITREDLMAVLDALADTQQQLNVAQRQRDYAIGANRNLLESLSRMTDHQARADTAEARVAELEGAVDGCRAVIKQRDARVAELEAEREQFQKAIDTLDCPTWSDVTHAIHVAQQRAERDADPAPDTNTT